MKRTALILIALALLIATAAPAFGATPAGPEASASPAKAWYADAAAKYAYRDIFGDMFQPNRPITRLEFARLLAKAFSIDPKNADSNGGPSNVVKALYEAGIIWDMENFLPEGELDRATMVHWVINTLDYLTGGQYALIMIMPEPFADDALIPDSYRDQITKAVILKLIYGRGGNVFAPLESATCAEAVVLVDRLAGLAESLVPEVAVTARLRKEAGALVMSMTIKNNMKEALTIHHPSAQRYDFKLFDQKGNHLYTWSLNRMFALIMGATEIGPGESVTYTERLEGEEFKDVIENAFILKAYIAGTSEDFVIEEEGYSAVLPG